jgi:hypothetical protein
MSELPKGCFEFTDHQRIIRRDINMDRPSDQGDISCERAIAHRRIVKKRGRLFKPSCWVVLSTTTYEMSGRYYAPYMGGRSWAETDLTGLEWKFNNEADANAFAFKE